MTEVRSDVNTEDHQDRITALEYDEFESWYNKHCSTMLDPARNQIVNSLNSLLDEELLERDRAQVRVVGSGRTKAPRRTWGKLHRDKYLSQVSSFEDIPKVIDDLIGIRITCNNLVDQRRVQVLLEALVERSELAEGDVLVRQMGSARNYVEDVKASGYRAYHCNLLSWVTVGLKRYQVVAELQVRTVLQDAWGELTHEDTYQAGSIPRLVVPLSRRLADLLRTLDDLAEDLRQELDQHEAETVTAASPDSNDPTRLLSSTTADLANASEYLRRIVLALQRPMDLASIAWSVRKEFGDTTNWFGMGSFKGLLLAAVPDVDILEEGPSYVIPKGFGGIPLVPLTPPERSKLPEAILFLRRVDRSFPILKPTQFSTCFQIVSELLNHLGPSELTIPIINDTSKEARNRSEQLDTPIPRSVFGYVLKALARRRGHGTEPGEVGKDFLTAVVERIAGLGYSVDESGYSEIATFLGLDGGRT